MKPTSHLYALRVRLCAMYLPLAALLSGGCHRAGDSSQNTAAVTRPTVVVAPLPLKLTFKDVTQAAGIDFKQNNGATGRHYFLETTGSGACWFDYDNDGWMDFYIVQNGPLPGSAGFGPGGNHLYHNNHNSTFSDVTKTAGVAGHGYGQGCSAADIDNDGFVDLFATAYGHNVLYHNNGNGTFADITVSSGLSETPGWSTSAAFADYDNDGLVDLFVGHYCAYRVGQDPPCTLVPKLRGYCPPNQFQGESGHLYHNAGHGRFTDVTRAAGVWNEDGKNLGVVWADFNDDGEIDLFVANDNRRNLLFQNKGGTFKETALRAGIALSEDGRTMAGMGADLADYDNDGQLDLAVANFADEPNALWQNAGKGLFNDVTFPSGVGSPSLPFLGFGLTFFDADLDGFKDLVVTNGHVQDNIGLVRKDASFAQPALFYRNAGNGTFGDRSHVVGRDFVQPRVGRGLCVADFDNDGDLDILLINLNGPPALLRNDGGNRNHHLVIRCVGTRGNRDAIGARVSVESTGMRQVAEVRSASSYLSQNDPRLFFGLGRALRADRVEVRWPSGRRSVLQNVAADQPLRLVEDKS